MAPEPTVPAVGIGISSALRDLVEESREDGGTERMHLRLDRYARAKRTWSLRMKCLLGQYEPRRAVKCHQCAGVLHFKWYPREAKTTLAGGYFCNQWKLCITCAMKRGAKQLRVIAPKIIEQLKSNPKLRAYLVTFTTVNTPDCAERFAHLVDSMRAYFERRNDGRKKGRGKVEGNKAVGIYWSVEGGRGERSGEWHWHCHMVWLCEYRPNPLELSAEWSAITGDSRIVHVRPFDATRRENRARADFDQLVTKGVLEVCKYTLKPHEMTPADAYEAFAASTHRHFTGCLGSLRLSAEESEAIAAKYDNGPKGADWVDIFVRYDQERQRYVEMDTDGVGEHLVRLGARAVNRELDLPTILHRRAVMNARPLELGGRGGAAPELDTRAILGDRPPDPGPPIEGPTRGDRLRADPTPSEDRFALP